MPAPSLPQLYVLDTAAKNGRAWSVRSATAFAMEDAGWARARPGHRRGVWTVQLTDAGRQVHADTAPERIAEAVAHRFRR